MNADDCVKWCLFLQTLLKFIDRFLVGPEVQNILKNVQRKIDPGNKNTTCAVYMADCEVLMVVWLS